MKNLYITPESVVPIDLRIEIYKEAIELITNDKERQGKLGTGLCIVLPSLLWV